VVPTRAAENHLFVACANFPHEQNVHNNPHHLAFCGQSAVVAPDGTDLARAGPNEERLLLVEVDFANYHAALVRNPYWHDRRPELYADVLQTERA
jgi:5-aminopentanamidase